MSGPVSHHVDVVKSDWLPASETFLRTQTDAMTRWRPRCVGTSRVRSPLARSTDVIVDGVAGIGELWARSRPDLVHVHWATEAVPLLPLVREHGLPLVVTTHGMDVSRRRYGTESGERRHRALVREVLAAADVVVAPSHHLASRAVAAGAPPRRVEVHYIGVPVPEHVPEIEPGAPADLDVSVVARLVPVKGVGDVLRACEAAGRRLGRVVRVGIAGDGPQRHELRATATALPHVEAEFLGAVPSAEVRRLHLRARVAMGGSTMDRDGAREGFGLALLEASALGRPVVAYDSGGVAEAITPEVTGLLAPEGDVGALGEHLGTLLGDARLRERLGAAGRRRVVEDYDVARRTAELEELYDRVAAMASSTASARSGRQITMSGR